MSDLISREALIKLLKDYGHSGDDDYIVEAVNTIPRITNAPVIEQGEAVIDKAAYDGAREDLSIWKRRALEAEEKVRKYDQRIVDIGVIAMTPVTTPQQPQSVADVLEEAAKICDELHYNWRIGDESGPNDCAKAIRALIKRNAVKEGE